MVNKYGIETRLGFAGRIFLSKEEWVTFCRVLPVRYIKKSKQKICNVCGLHESQENIFHNSHVIPFALGVTHLGLTPDYVNSDENIVTAHKKDCNKESELDLRGCIGFLKRNGVKAIPEYLPSQIQKIWDIT